MITYEVNSKKKEICLEKYRNNNEKTKGLYKFDKAFLPVSSIIAIIYLGLKILKNDYLLPLGLIIAFIVLVLTMLKLFVHVFYLKFASTGFIERMNETITLKDNGLIYSNHSIESVNYTSTISTEFLYSNIDFVRYNKKTEEIIIVGEGYISEYIRGELVDRQKGNQISVLNYFDCDLIDIFRKNNVRVEE